VNVLVDTPIWSYALRTPDKEHQHEIDRLTSLIRDQRALIIGPIRQEILSGYSDVRKFKKLREKLSFFENTPIQDIDYESAAELCNQCKRIDVPIFTTDKDFSHYQKAIPIKLYQYPA